jgi:hypothetical protein
MKISIVLLIIFSSISACSKSGGAIDVSYKIILIILGIF